MRQIVRHEVFGQDSKPTIYYFTGYGGKLSQYRPHIRLLTLLGFRVVAFEYDKAILNAGDPTLLPGAIAYMHEIVSEDKLDHTVAGVYGISLGSYLGLNIMSLCDIDKGMFNTGGVSMVDTIWTNQYLHKEKAAFETNGHNRAALDKAWGSFEVDKGIATKLQDKKLLFMASTGDTVLLYEETARNVAAWQAAGVNVRLLTVRWLEHSRAIVRNIFRLIRTARFFLDAKKLSRVL